MASRIKKAWRALTGKEAKNSYDGARSSRLTADWLTANQTADDILRWNLRQLRARSRDLARNNDYAKSFFRKLKTNVIGHNGIQLQNKAMRLVPDDKRPGKLKQIPDITANRKIEQAWTEWGKKQNCTVSGTQSWLDVQNLALQTMAQDGECLVRLWRGFDNAFRFAVQVLEPDYLDENYNCQLSNGNTIRMGIEFDKWGKPITYHLFKQHPGNGIFGVDMERIPVPASDILHIFIQERPTQGRGVPWMHTAILRLRMLGAFEEAALVNARVGASKTQTIIRAEDAAPENYADGKKIDPYGTLAEEVAPGQRDILPFGTEVHDSNPTYPSNEFDPFRKAMLRGGASGIGVAYNGWSSDLEGVTFGTLRQGMIEERDFWMVVQTSFAEQLHDGVYDAWLDPAILSGKVLLPYAKIDIFRAANWVPRTWQWIDPEKDVNSTVTELEGGIATYRQKWIEKGLDPDDMLQDLIDQKKVFDENGLDFRIKTRGQTTAVAGPVDESATTGGGNGKQAQE